MPKSRYLPITQQPYCCVPACLQMVLHRRGLGLPTQEAIGKSLGLTVPRSDLRLLPHALTGDEPSSGWGTRVQDKGRSINDFFEASGYKLREAYLDPDGLPDDLPAWINNEIERGNDLLACFSYSAAFGGEGDNGHVCVVDSCDEDTVTLIDPWYLAPKFRSVTVERLTGAMSHHAKTNRAGFWVISSK